MMIGTQAYPWNQQVLSQGGDPSEQLPSVLDSVAAAGINAWESSVSTQDEARRLERMLRDRGLSAPSMYCDGNFHDSEAEATVEKVTAQASWMKACGTRLVTVNPNPISWSEPLDKSDDQLRCQVRALAELGQRLNEQGQQLAYHTHSPEMRCAAREFHHMLRAVPSDLMGLCLDFHWIYRGAGNSHVALEDILDMYVQRVVLVHLRQSLGGVWTEHLDVVGDLDYPRLLRPLFREGFRGPFIIETATEADTPSQLSPVEAHARSRAWVEQQIADVQPAAG